MKRRELHGLTVGKRRPAGYSSWMNMIERCENPRHPKWPRYGGRGIRVCPAWRASFVTYWADMGPRPSPSHTPDRINNDGNYEPGNVRWATKLEQALNQPRNVRVSLGGATRCVSEWADVVGIKRRILYRRLSFGWTPEDAFTIPPTR